MSALAVRRRTSTTCAQILHQRSSARACSSEWLAAGTEVKNDPNAGGALWTRSAVDEIAMSVIPAGAGA
jgi:hypothetical protein